jgi:GAF domain-containing protein
MAHADRLQAVLTRFARTMTGGYDLSAVLYRLTDDVTEVLDIAGAGIAVSDGDDQLRYATASSDEVAVLERVQEEHQEGPCAEAFRSQEPVTISDIEERTDWVAYRSEARRLGFNAVAGVPLSLATERFGALNLYDRGPRSWTEEELSLARVLADVAAGYLVQGRLEDTRRVAEQLQYALDTRVVIEQAKGILSAEWGVSVVEAFERLRRYCRNNNLNLRGVAQEVVAEGFRLDRDRPTGDREVALD